MIIGNGLIAKAFVPYFHDNDKVIIYASGVSNSKETRLDLFKKEELMVIDAIKKNKHIIYFSSCSILDPEMSAAPYVLHKKTMEELISSSSLFSVFRLPQVVGDAPNPNTLTNYLFKNISAGIKFNIWLHAKRNLIDASDIALIASFMINNNLSIGKVINIAAPSPTSILQLVNIFEKVIGKSAKFDIIAAGASYEIEASLCKRVSDGLGINFYDEYIEKILRKYYGKEKSTWSFGGYSGLWERRNTPRINIPTASYI